MLLSRPPPRTHVRPERVEFPVSNETSPCARRFHLRRISLGVQILNPRQSLLAARNMYISVLPAPTANLHIGTAVAIVPFTRRRVALLIVFCTHGVFPL